jgi:hypothetical protein
VQLEHLPRQRYAARQTPAARPVVEDKAARVAPCSKNLCKEIGNIAHSCGITEPQQLQRWHCRVVQ